MLFLNNFFTMNKYILLSTLILLNFNSYTQSTLHGVVHYESSYSQKNINNYFSKERKLLEDKDKEGVKIMDNIFLNTKKVKSTLTFSNKESIYKVNKKLSIIDRGNLAEKFSLLTAGGSNIFYTSIITNTNETQNCQTLDECFLIKSKFKKWQLTQETKEISGYVCYKAIFVENVKGKIVKTIAWYTPKITVSFGPKGYNGLPGLVLELDNEKLFFKATKIILNPKEKVKILKPTKGDKVTEEEFQVLVKKVSDHLFGKRN